MFQALRNIYFTQFFWGFVGLYLLNLSVDTIDPGSSFAQEDLSFNDQESIVELVVEKWLGYENAIAEFEDLDTEENKSKGVQKIDFIASSISAQQQFALNPLSDSKSSLFSIENIRIGFTEIDGPPPKF